jgi:hypothetical protein
VPYFPFSVSLVGPDAALQQINAAALPLFVRTGANQAAGGNASNAKKAFEEEK